MGTEGHVQTGAGNVRVCPQGRGVLVRLPLAVARWNRKGKKQNYSCTNQLFVQDTVKTHTRLVLHFVTENEYGNNGRRRMGCTHLCAHPHDLGASQTEPLFVVH